MFPYRIDLRSKLLLRLGNCFVMAIVHWGSALASDNSNAQERIRVVLSVRCVGCHNALEKNGGLDLSTRESVVLGGDNGPAASPGSAKDSLIWKRIESNEMPPKKPLPPEESQLIREWIENGAVWPGKSLNPMEFTSDSRAGYDWWSLQPLHPQTPPEISGAIVHPVDAFIVSKLNQEGMELSPPADRRTLARRLAYDLTGLPPVHASAQELLDDESSGAISKWIDQLLDSPHYGQRWARHWLDTVRFGESHGFERDQLRTNAWRYRDWVVDSFNSDMPYDEFCRLQIAGDFLQPESAQGRIATGMLVCGAYDQVGQTQQSKAMREVVRQDELEDLVSVVSQTFLGLTVNCSRCHDHKFDPISQHEYYAMCAALAGTHHGEPKVKMEDVYDRTNSVVARLENRHRQLTQAMELIERPVRERLLAERAVSKEKIEAPEAMACWEFDDLRDSMGGLELELRSTAVIRDGRLHLSGSGFAISKSFKREIREKTLEVWVVLGSTDQRGGGAFSIEADQGDVFDAIVFGETEPRRWTAGSNSFQRTESFHSNVEESNSGELIQVVMVYQSDGTIRAYRNGAPYGTSYRKSELVRFPRDTSHALFGLRHSPPSDSRMLQGALERAQLYDRALSGDEIEASWKSLSSTGSTSELMANLNVVDKETLSQLRFELKEVSEQLQRAKDSKVYAVVSKQPSKTFVLARGNSATPLGAVLPGGVSAVRGIEPDFQLDDLASDGERRMQLARWIADKKNPLFSRVIVNRVWQYHFGAGIVETPNDFGFNGGRPSHPELLDWLANDLIEHGWSLKHLHRRILTSKTYQQSSIKIPTQMERDASNRWLWRKSPTRLDAESLRDTFLQLAGQLDNTVGGPGYYDFEFKVHNSHFYFMRDPIGATFQRRTLYRTVVRSGRSNLLDVFDCPDPSAKSPQRASTTTPLQSLSLMNNSFVVRMAEAWAQRAASSENPTARAQVIYLFQQAFLREPQEEELSACIALADKHGLSTVCRALLNSNELLYVD
jgi:hypothetical protein